VALEALAREWHAQQVGLAEQAVRHAKVAWSAVDARNAEATWARYLPRLTLTVAAGMRLAATNATRYVSTSVESQGGTPRPVGVVDAAAFAQSASDGRSLGSLFYLPAMRAQSLVVAGFTVEQAKAAGLEQLAMLVATQMADAGRVAVGAGMVADKSVTHYVRIVSAGACERCAILAGKVFSSWQAASFERHPNCDCTAAPLTSKRNGERVRTDPRSYFNSLSTQRQDQVFGKAGAQAIRDGADISQVVNARRGMSVAGRVPTTTSGTTRSGLAGARLQGRARLMPEGIYDLASDRSQAIDLLRAHGYII